MNYQQPHHDQFDQFDIDWEALTDSTDYDQVLSLFANDMGTNDGFDFFDMVDSDESSLANSTSRKHKREQPLPPAPPVASKQIVATAPLHSSKYNSLCSDIYSYEAEETAQMVKMMRPSNFERIIAESVVASGGKVSSIAEKIARPVVPQMTFEERCKVRKDIVVKFMRCLNFSDMGTLAKVIRENCHERVMYMSPDIKDPIYGKADLMISYSLMMEAFPDGVWKVVSTENEEDKVACTYNFRGTKVFPYPLETVLKQIKAHMNKEVYMSSTPAMASIQLVHDIAERVHPTVAERFQESQRVQSLHNSSSNSLSADIIPDLQNMTTFNDDLHKKMGTPRTQPPRSTQLRPTRMMEATVLKEGLVNYRRKTDFIFDEYNQIVRVIAEAL